MEKGMYKKLKLFFVYPQYIFAKHICKLIFRNIDTDDINFIDAPCGNGVISYWMSKYLPNSKFNLYDIDKNSIDTFNTVNTNLNIVTEQKDIVDIDIDINHKKTNILLLINSLYLLTERDSFIENLTGVDYIVGVFPNINGKNFDCFLNYIYKNEFEIDAMTVEQTNVFFKEKGYEMIEGSYIISNNFYCMKFKRIMRRVLIFFDTPNEDIKNAYYAAIYKKV
jgi:hypothetical protein